MSDKERIITDLREALDSVDITSDLRLVLIHAIEYLQREPASEDLKKTAYNHCVEQKTYSFYDSFKAGSKWQKQKDQESICEVNCTPKSDDLEEEIEKIWTNCATTWVPSVSGESSLLEENGHYELNLSKSDFKNIAHHFAEWQKDKMNLLLQTEYEKGLFDMREAMMKDALDGCVSLIVKSDTDSRNLFISTPQLYKELRKYENGTKLKIIIVKED